MGTALPRGVLITGIATQLAFPDAHGFSGQGWHTQETMMAARWLLHNPAAWAKAMTLARAYPGNPHTVADTLHEQIMPRSELAAISAAGGDPAKVDWLEIAHELIERRDDPRPAQDLAGIAAQVAELAAGEFPGSQVQAQPPVPDNRDAVTMYTAHRIDDMRYHLAHAAERLTAARDTSGRLRDYHVIHLSNHLTLALRSGQQLADSLREHYPAEGSELDALTKTVGLAKSLSPAAKAATTAHLLQTVLYHAAHCRRHAEAMGDDGPQIWDFNADHIGKHLDGAREHVAKLTEHITDNYPAEDQYLKGLEQPGTISGQMGEES